MAYQSNTQDFWNSCTQLAGKSDYRVGGSFFDGKGQPPQVSAVSHGCPTTRFNNINVLGLKEGSWLEVSGTKLSLKGNKDAVWFEPQKEPKLLHPHHVFNS